MQELAITTIAHYYLLHRLARGGMSEVYLALDTRHDQLVALKLVPKNHAEHCERFRREVQLLAGLDHEHILSALDYGENEAWCYMVTPYIEYGTLSHRLEQGPLTPAQTGALLEQLVSALQFIHDHGILHRDIKPSNILLRDGQYVYLTDFGLAQKKGANDEVEQTGCLMGTAEYMAPELAEYPATRSSDIYALGVLLYQMLTGGVPFKGNSPMGVYWKHIHEQPRPLSQLNPSVPESIERVVLRALEKSPRRRFRTPCSLLRTYQRTLAPTEQKAAVKLTLAASFKQALSLNPYKVKRPQSMHSFYALSGIIAVLVLLLALPTLSGSLSHSSIIPEPVRAQAQAPRHVQSISGSVAAKPHTLDTARKPVVIVAQPAATPQPDPVTSQNPQPTLSVDNGPGTPYAIPGIPGHPHMREQPQNSNSPTY